MTTVSTNKMAMSTSTLINFAIDFLDDDDDVNDYFPNDGSYFNKYYCLCMPVIFVLNAVLCSIEAYLTRPHRIVSIIMQSE